MNTRDREPLTPEERDLAQRLSRLGGHAQPSAALDAKILAAARDAVQPRPRRTRPRWPLGMGIAASLALAVGVAWQLRPLPETGVMQGPSEAAPAAIMRDATHAASGAEPPTVQHAELVAAADAVAAPDDAAAPAASQPVAEPAPPMGEQPQAAAQRTTADDAPREDAPAAALLLDTEPPPHPPAPPAPPAAAAPAPAAMPTEAAAKVRAQEQEQRALRSESTAVMRSAGARPDPALDTVTVTGSRIRQARPAAPERIDEYIDEPLDDRPPASFATPEARDAWLQRIRELVAEGEHAAARASLEEFRRRYPQHPLPADLKALLAE